MLIMSTSEAATAIGAKCGGSSPEDGDPRLSQLLTYMLPRLEGALNVESLVRGNFVDHFFTPAMPPYSRGERNEQAFRLSNGFVLPESVVVTDPEGIVYPYAEVPSLNADTGVLRINSWTRGTYSVAYTSGFAPEPIPDPLPDPYNAEMRVLEGVPDWMKAIVIHLLVIWFRTAQVQPRWNKDLSFAQVDTALRRELYARIYEKYDRPRVAVTFSERMDRVI